jgi:hypothetical protein
MDEVLSEDEAEVTISSWLHGKEARYDTAV